MSLFNEPGGINFHKKNVYDAIGRPDLKPKKNNMPESPLHKLKRLVGESESIRHGNLKTEALHKKAKFKFKFSGGAKKYSQREQADRDEAEDRHRMNDSQIER